MPPAEMGRASDAPALGVILAGGEARRLGGGDKGRLALAGGSVLDAVIRRFAPQVDPLILNANGDVARFADTGLPVVPDPVAAGMGPLAGVLAALEWARAYCPAAEHLVSVPTDAPFLPADLVPRLRDAAQQADTPLACAESGGRLHPVVALWPVALADRLRADLVQHGARRVDRWQRDQGLAVVSFSTDPVDPFLNINAPEDLAAARRWAGGDT